MTKRPFFKFSAICLALLLGAGLSYSADFDIDLPDFSNAKKQMQKGTGKIKQFKKDMDEALIRKTGKPTDQNLSDMTRKEKEDALLKSQSNGYYGTLPNIEREFGFMSQKSRKTGPKGQYKDTLLDEMNLKKAPKDDLYLDMVLKKGKDTQYTKDVLKIMAALERFKTCISTSCDLQQFNGNVNLIDLYAKNLEQKYSNTEDSNSESYYRIRNVAYLAKLQGNLKYESNFYSKYMPLQGTIYAKENIQKKDAELLDEINKTIFILKQLQ